MVILTQYSVYGLEKRFLRVREEAATGVTNKDLFICCAVCVVTQVSNLLLVVAKVMALVVR